MLMVLSAHRGIVSKRYTVSVPSHLNPAIPEERATIASNLQQSYLRLLNHQEGPFTCVVCGQTSDLFRTSTIYFPACIMDFVFCSCEGRCEIAAALLRDQMVLRFVREFGHGEQANLPFRVEMCLTCGQQHGISCCARCKQASYCSRNCQKMDWPRHKLDCQARSQTAPP